MLGLLAFAIFGPLLNVVLWAFTERWYFPHKLPLEYGLSFWQRVFRPQGHAMESLGTSLAIALFTVAVCLAVAIPAGYALARRSLPLRALILLAFLLPQAFPSLAVYINVARIFYSFGLNGTIAGVVLVHTTRGLVSRSGSRRRRSPRSTASSRTPPAAWAPRRCMPSSP